MREPSGISYTYTSARATLETAIIANNPRAIALLPANGNLLIRILRYIAEVPADRARNSRAAADICRLKLSSCLARGFSPGDLAPGQESGRRIAAMRRNGLLQKLSVFVGIRRRAAAQDFQFRRTGVVHPVRRPRRNADRIARIDGKYLIAPHHASLAVGDVINLFAAKMFMQLRALPHRHDGLRETLVCIAMHVRVHQLADDRTIFGGEGFDAGVTALLHGITDTDYLPGTIIFKRSTAAPDRQGHYD